MFLILRSRVLLYPAWTKKGNLLFEKYQIKRENKCSGHTLSSPGEVGCVKGVADRELLSVTFSSDFCFDKEVVSDEVGVAEGATSLLGGGGT